MPTNDIELNATIEQSLLMAQGLDKPAEIIGDLLRERAEMIEVLSKAELAIVCLKEQLR